MELQKMAKTVLITDITGQGDAYLALLFLNHGYAAFNYHE
jgi:GDP-D-mannose dehydratase